MEEMHAVLIIWIIAGTTSSSASNAMSSMDRSLKRGSGDIGWEYAELADASNLDRLKCKLCGKLVSGGIYRMKQHIAHIKGNMNPCKKSSDEDIAKCRNFIEEAKSKKKQKSRHEAEVRQEVILEGDEDNEASQGTTRKPHTLGPMDHFASPIDSDSSLDGSRKIRWVYEAGIPFHAIDSDSFKRFVEAVGQFGPGYRPPSQYQLREPLLKEEVERNKSSLKKQEEEWALNGIGNQPRFKGVIEKAKCFTIYIYAHHKTLALMRKFTKKRDIVRPGVTRFATAFLTLQSLMEKKNELSAMITSDEWNESKHAKSVKGKAAVNIALSASFLNGVSLCLKVFAPLVKVLHLVDGDRKPSMGFVYGELLRAKEEIKMAFKDQEVHYLPILDIVDGKARDRLDSPLHLAGYLLNPYYTYANPSFENDNVVMDGFFTCVEVFFPDDIQTQSLVTNVELHKYLKKEGGFGRALAKAGCAQNDDNYNPVLWWNIYGNLVPKLQSMAKRILSLTTSSPGCERNLSAFEGVALSRKSPYVQTAHRV
ncbi:uncharacterized protein LOC133711452 [Rosa rugosa]|uniref:uncharacterized protein LOC133711452 n=1 Tax=Rosa rugosa TaxID=74645 RepID=UPI002B40E487|nr:uncharacterized protein LOC133711452 [Rosa rugosa]